MLADLFKPAWKSSSVDKRLKAISAMDSANAEQQKILAQLACDDEDSTICIAAIHKLRSAPVLHELSSKLTNEKIRSEAINRLNALMGESAALTAQQYRELLSQYPELQVRIAAHAELAEVRREAMLGLSTDQLLELLSATVFTDSRQQIAEALEDIEALESARRIMRGKDKNAERIVKTKIDELRRQEREQAENLAMVIKLIEEVEYLSSHDWLPEFKGRCLAHRSRWDNLDFEIDAEMKRRYQVSREVLDKRYTEQLVIEQTRQSQQELADELQSLLQKITGRDLRESITRLSETQNKHEQIISNWESLALKSAPDSFIHDEYQKMVHAVHTATQLVMQVAQLFPQPAIPEHETTENPNQAETENKLNTLSGSISDQNIAPLNAALKKFNWPSGYGELQLESELRRQLKDWHQAQQDAAEAHELQLKLVHKNISSIFRFARVGNLARAKQVCSRVEKAIDQFTGKDRSALEERFEEARKTLGNMGDWKNFATEPKHIELCEAMEKLGSSSQHPDQLSSEMKALQQQWKALGHSDISDQYWPRFKEAADKVYQPCAVFFAERHKLRKTNLAQREKSVEQMRELLEKTDWENNPDFKMAESTLHSINDQFIAIKEVERNAGQKQWKQFSRLKDDVFAKLNVAYDANITLKQQLVQQAEALAESPAKLENLARLKTLQTRWKQIGITRRKQDQKAWKAFKKQGDLVYNRVQALRQGQREETDQQLNAYREIIKEIQMLAKTAKELSEADQQFSLLQASYSELPDLPPQLPEKLIEGLQRDYRNACAQFDACRIRIINSMQTRELDALRRRADLCTRLEALGETPEPQQLEQITAEWDKIELHDAALSRRIEARRQSAQTVIDRSALTAERRLLCIQLEIATGAETPSGDKALRMQYQLEQMHKSGLGSQALNNDEQLKDMELDWLCMPGAEPQHQSVLDERFRRALQAK